MNNKFLLFTNLIFLSAALFFACDYSPSKTPVSKKKCTDCMEYNNVKASSKLDVNLLRAMTYNYQYNPATQQIDDNKTRSVWISLEKLKQFVYEIEKGTCNCPEENLGVRIYLGVYPGDQDWINPSGFQNDLNNPNAPDGDFRSQIIAKNQSLGQPAVNTYAGITTIFMVPTINSGNGNIDFDPANNVNGCKGGYNIDSFYKRAGGEKDFKSVNSFLHKSLGISITALSATNHGDACPPPVRGCQQLGSFSGFDH